MAFTATAPTDQPRWADVGGDIVEPSEGKKDVGWVDAEEPAAEHMNWLQNLAYLWIAYFKLVVDEIDSLFLRKAGGAMTGPITSAFTVTGVLTAPSLALDPVLLSHPLKKVTPSALVLASACFVSGSSPAADASAYNISSVVKNSTGNYTVTFSQDIYTGSTRPAVLVTSLGGSLTCGVTFASVNSVTVDIINASATPTDSPFMITVIGAAP